MATSAVGHCNLAYPVIRVSPSFGEGMRVHAEGIEYMTPALQRFFASGVVHCAADLGSWIAPGRCQARLEIRGLGIRPAGRILASATASLPGVGLVGAGLEVSFDTTGSSAYPEYLAELVVKPEDGSNEVRRVLHILLPPASLVYEPHEVLGGAGTTMQPRGISQMVDTEGAREGPAMSRGRRRGFGLELETVQLPPDPDVSGAFNKQQEFHGLVQRLWSADRRGSVDRGGIGTAGHTDAEWERLLKWTVCHDCQVGNASPPARIELYNRWIAAAEGTSTGQGVRAAVRDAVLGGDAAFRDDPRFPGLGRVSLASPEYNSPAPPHELYYEFPGPDGGPAEREIRLLLDGVLTHPTNPSPVLLPTVSAIGQSASSIHVHVNVRNRAAWPHEMIGSDTDNAASTRALLSVVVNWIRFDGVIRSFAKPWMWRERSLAPLFAAGPEFIWREVSWNHGTSHDDNGILASHAAYNVPAFFRHAFCTCQEAALEKSDVNEYEKGTGSYGTSDRDGINQLWKSSDRGPGEPEKKTCSLFERVFDYDAIFKTLWRNCSMNLLAINKYGTIEFRRMHATFDSDFVVAYTRFCVAFVEKFSSDYARFAEVYFDAADDWEEGLARLIAAQNDATIEDLIDVMVDDAPGFLTRDCFHILSSQNVVKTSQDC